MSALREAMEALLEAGWNNPGDTYKGAASKMLKMRKYNKNMFVRAYLIAVREGDEPDSEWAKKAGAKLAAQVRKELVDLS
jgi:hypothetical protein